MGQRSQIYFRYNTREGKKQLVATYFGWNYGTRMVSRARGILEWAFREKEFASLFYPGSDTITRLKKVIDINWDYKDVVNTSDIIKEYTEGYYSSSEEMFTAQDNNDGQLIIDMIIDYNRKNSKGDYIVKFKYAFLDYDSNYIGDAESYLQWNENYGEEGPSWRESQYIQKEIKYTERNIRYIEKHAKLMTEEEAKEFISHDYAKDMGLVIKKGE